MRAAHEASADAMKTPRTDAAPKWLVFNGQTQTTLVQVEFARDLERELAREREHADRLAKALIATAPNGEWNEMARYYDLLSAHAALRATDAESATVETQ